MAGLQSLIQSRAAGQPGQMPGQMLNQRPGQMLNQMPGQAGAFTALPSPQGRNPAAYTRALKQIPPEDLIRIYNDTDDMRPKWAVASAYADAMKGKALKQRVMGQQAQAENVAAQQTPPVADQVMAVMAASGGEMKAYDQGGIVALQSGGDPEIQRILRKHPATRTQEENARLEAAGISLERRTPAPYDSWISRLDRFLAGPFLREAFTGGANRLSEDELRKRNDAGALTETIARALGSEQTAPVAPVAAISGPRPVERNRTAELPAAVAAPGAVPAPDGRPAAAASAAEAPDNLTAYARRLEEAENERNKVAREGANISPEVLAARQRMEQLSGRRLQQFQQDAEKIRSEGIRQLQGRLDAARRPLIDDPEALLSLAASINPQRGKTVGSMAQGLASILGQRRARAEKAEEGISALSEKVRLLNSQYQEAEALEEQRKYAILTQDANLKRETDQKIADNNVRMRQTQAEIDIRLQDVQAKRDAARASGESAAASREGNRLNMLTQRQLDRERVVAAAKKRFEDNQSIRMAKQLAERQGATDEDKQKYKNMLNQFKAELEKELAPIDESISQLRKLSGLGSAPATTDLSGWGALTITQPTKQ